MSSVLLNCYEKMLTDLKDKIIETTEVIDMMISTYFANRLGVKDIQTINALGKKGKLTFNQKVNLFCDIMPLSKIDKSKFKVYTKINNEVVINKGSISDENYFNTLNCYTPFLLNIYLEDDKLNAIKDKFSFVVDQLISDLVKITSDQIEKPQIYYNKKVGIILPE